MSSLLGSFGGVSSSVTSGPIQGDFVEDIRFFYEDDIIDGPT